MSDNEYKRIFSYNLRHFMQIRGKTQKDLMTDLGFSSSTVSNWCTGEKLPRMDKVQMLADYLHINKSDLLEDKPLQSSVKAVTINVLGRVAAGIPIEATTDIIDTEEIPEEMAKTGDFFALKIKGNSMEPRIMDGDVVIVRKQDEGQRVDDLAVEQDVELHKARRTVAVHFVVQ